MKFAVIETGGKQYKISEGDSLLVEKLADAHTVGDKVVFDKVLLVSDEKGTVVGAPYVAGAKVEVELEKEGKRKKVVVIKFKQKSRYFKKRGHRQMYSKISVKNIA